MITYYDNIKEEIGKETNKIIDFNKLIKELNDPKIKLITDRARKIDKINNKPEYRKQQSNLPIICAGAYFKEHSTHSINNITEPTHFVLLDYDGIENVDDIIEKLKELLFIRFIYRSSSGKGFKVIVKCDLNSIATITAEMTDNELNEMYNRSYGFYYDYLGDNLIGLTKVEPDGNAKDISRCSYIAYDDKYFFNRNSTTFKITPREAAEFEKRKLKNSKKSENKVLAVGSTEVAFMNEVIDYLVEHKLDVSEGYNNWIYLAFVCKKLYEPKIAMIKYHQLCQFNPQYKESECSKKFNAILKTTNDRPTSFNYLDGLLKDNGIHFIPKTKSLFNEKLSRVDIHKIMKFENWEIKFCKIKKLNYIHIPDLQNTNFPNDIIPLELSGRKGLPVIIRYFMDRYTLELNQIDIDNAIYSYESKPFNFISDYLEQNKTDDDSEYKRFFTLIESDDIICSGMTRWFLGTFQNWLNDSGRKFDEMLILHDNKGNIGKTDLINNHMFSILKYNDLKYITSNINFDISNKDALIDDFGNLISYKPEVSSNILKKSEQVKDYISRRDSNVRVPYGRHQECFTSYTSYIGDTNDEHFLSAEYNRRRFIVIKINKLNFLGKNFDWNKFWGYLYYMYKDKGLRYKDFQSINNEEYVEMNTDISLLEEIVSQDENNSITTSELISMIKMDVTSFRSGTNEVSKYLRMKGYEYKSRRVPHLGNKVKKGWNISININNANQVVL